MEEMETSSNSRKRRERDNPIEDDEIDNSRSVKRTRTRTMPEVAGKIACIELENFMCHKTLKMNFDVYERNCSYIVGANGSGKSAIFASINIGLGGSGRSNERGKNVQDYIKEGEEDAMIRIHLTNEGPNAIPEYDNIIVVERRITKRSSQFILKSRCGNKEQILHKKNVKHELDLILQQFNIELDNPLSWLSQDRARQFLQSMKPEKLYELYRQSSEMDTTEQLFRNIDLLFKELTKVINSMDNEKRAKEEKYHQEKARFDAVTTLKEKKTMVQKLLWHQLWAPIRDCQNEIVTINEKLAENMTKRNVNLKLRDDFTKRIEQIEKGLTQKGQDQEKLTSKTREHNDRVNEMKKNIRKLDFELNENNSHIKILEGKVRTVDAELTQGRLELNKLLGNTNRNLDKEKQTLQNRQNQIAEQMQKLEEDKGKNATELRTAVEDAQNERQIYQNIFSDYVQTDNQLKRTIEEKQAFERSKVNILNLFGQDMPNLVKLIDENVHLFTKKPIGPIGNFVKLRDHRWADPVEYILRSVMGVILCNSVEDRKVLDEICTNNQIRKPQIVTTTFTQSKFDVSENEPAPIYNTVARMIEVDEPTAFNFIVDRIQAESLLLFDQDEIARKEMYPNAPKNATKALTLTCSEVNPQRGRRPYQFVHNQFRSRIFANRAMANEARDFDGQIRALEQSKIQKNSECKKFESNAKSNEKAIQLRKKREEIESKLMELNQRRYEIEENLRKLEDIMTSQDRIVNMQNSIEEFEEERKKYLAQLETKRTAYREIKEKMTEHQDKLNASQHTSLYFKGQFNQIQNDIESLQLQQRKIQQRIETIGQSLANHDNLERDYNSKLEEKRNAIERQRKEAESKGVEMQEELREILPEIGDGGQPNFEDIPETGELKKQLQTIQREIRIQEENREEPLTAEELRKLQDEYIDFKRQVKDWQRRYKVLKRIIEKRKEALEAIAASLPRKLELWFKDYMNFRNFKGSIVVNDAEGTIHIHVETHKMADELDETAPTRIAEKRTRGRNFDMDGEIEKRNTREKQIMQDLRGLSGGERSYTTACFIMSLWKCMESPFRLMDEFDVFMDMVNRRVIMEMLADLAKETQKIQFFFFTPQPIHELKRDEFEVFQLKKIHGRIFGDQDE